MRDAMGSLRNLEQLLHSMRVGPRAISSVLPAVHASCSLITGSMTELLEAMASRLPSRAPIDALLGYVTPRVQELDRALASAVPKPMYAKNRLKLESVVTRLAGELDGARELLDVLDGATWGRPVRVELGELLRGGVKREAQADLPGSRLVDVTVARAAAAEALVSPRVAMGLMAIGVAWVAAQRTDAMPHVDVHGGPEGSGLEISFGARSGDTMTVSVPPLLEPTLLCAETAAALSGAKLSYIEAPPRFSLDWVEAH